MKFDHLQSIYRSYDIRGEFPSEINAIEVEKIGRALVAQYGAQNIVIGHDFRPSSEELTAALVKGVTEQGADATLVGLVTTPMLYHASGTIDSEVSVMVSGSHMPPEFNGLKICIGQAVPIGLETGLDKIRDLVAANDFPTAEKTGAIKELDIKPAWREHCTSLIKFDPEAPLKVVVDPANMVGILEIETIKQFDCLSVTTIYDNYDWTCPNHEANPINLDTMADLGKKVAELRADMGIALDGDADRIGIVDETGQPVPQDMIGVLIAKEILSRLPAGQKIIHDVRSSKRIAEVAGELAGEAVPYRIGHTHLRRKMAEIDAVYAFELSGHHFFREMHNSEGGIYPALLLLEIVQKSGKKLSELVAAEQIYFHSSEINSEINCRPEEIYEALKAKYADAIFETIDGLTVQYENWWFNLRPSANDPVMRLNLEADSRELMEEKRDEVLGLVRK